MKKSAFWTALVIVLTGLCGCTHEVDEQNGSSNCDISQPSYCADGMTAMVCLNGHQQRVSCANGCNMQTGQCIQTVVPECNAADYPRCDGNDALTCVGGKIYTKPCGSLMCTNGTCQDQANPTPDPECNTADYPRCDGNDALTCIGGQIFSKPCEGQICINGTCQDQANPTPDPECDAADYPKCDGNHRLTCVHGQIQSESCGSQTCQAGVCQDISAEPECDAADYPKCDGNTLFTCADGQIQSELCKPGHHCDAVLAQCVEDTCEPGAVTCRGLSVATCNNQGKWEIEACQNGEKCSNGKCVPRGDEPEVVSCGVLNISGSNTCSVQHGTGSRLVIRGDILGLDKTYAGGTVILDGEKITYVGCDFDANASANKTATVITCPDGVISPGFINGHEHITFSNGKPATWGDERFDHRHDWRKGKNQHTELPSDQTSKNNGNSVVEMRALLSGTTSIFGSGSAPGLARNLDIKSQTAGNVQAVYQTFPLGDASDGTIVENGCGSYNFHSSVREFDDSCPYGPHIAEGINQGALNELRCLGGANVSKAVDIFKPNVAVIHGIAATVDIIQKMAQNGVKLIWSPRTNISLYGDTAQAPLYDTLGVTIGLGTDWLYSGSANMLRELQCVDYLNQNHYSLYFSDYEIWKMPTYNTAVALGVDQHIGQIAKGLQGDLVVFKKSATRQGYRAVIDAENKDVLLVTLRGKPIYGDANLLKDGSQFDVCGVKKKFDFDAANAKDEIIHFEFIEAAANYPMFFCGTPENEPTCVPARLRKSDTQDQGTTSYDGDYTDANDADGDGIADDIDNCPTMFNPVRPMDTHRKQSDVDADGYGDICDLYPACQANDASCDNGTSLPDADGDGIADESDNCPDAANNDQKDTDNDGKGDKCDACPSEPNPGHMTCPDGGTFVLDFSCSGCHEGSGYSMTYVDAVGNYSITASGMVGISAECNHANGITMTGSTNYTNYIKITGLDGIGTLSISYYSYNPTGQKGTLEITAGTHHDTIQHTYDANHVQEVIQSFTYDDNGINEVLIAPAVGENTGNRQNRIHVTRVSWTTP